MVSEVESRLGALVVEGCLTLMLYGVLTVQAYVFMLSCQKDSVFTKTIAFAVWTLESLVSAFMVHALYHYTMEIFGHPDLIDNMVWSAPSLYTADRIVVTLVQGYCVWRIWQLSAKSFSTIVPALLWIGRTAISFTILAFLWKFPTWTKIHQDHLTRQVIISCLSVGLASDIAVMAYMIHFLKRDQTGFKGTDHVIRAMISSTVNSGAGVVAASIGLLATYLSAKASLAFVGFITISSVSYANMFFGLLNAGHALRKNAAIISKSSTQELSTMQNGRSHNLRQPIEILSVQETETSDGVVKTATYQDDMERDGSINSNEKGGLAFNHKNAFPLEPVA